MRAALIATALALFVSGCGEEQDSERPAQTNDSFPVSIEHKFGTTVVEQPPKRVVTVGFNDQDFALALGVTPVGVRQFQGGIDITERPWAQDELGGADPQIIGAEELEFEKIAALRPDLILAVYSGLTERDYGTLSKLAPTVAQTGEYPDYGVPWEEQAEVSSRALGREEQGAEVVDDVESEIAGVRREHPEFEGSSFVLASASAGSIYVYGPQDLRSRFFNSLGFETPAQIEELAGDSFYAQLERGAAAAARPGRGRRVRHGEGLRRLPAVPAARRRPRGARDLHGRGRRLRQRARLQQPAEHPVRARAGRAAARRGGQGG